MNQLFLQSLDKISKNSPKNAALIEAVKKAYINCEHQAQLEGRFGKLMGAAALTGIGALTALGVEHHNAVADHLKDAGHTATEYVKDAGKKLDEQLSIEDDIRNMGHLAEQREGVGEELLSNGWHTLKYTDKPDLISDTYKSDVMAYSWKVADLKEQPYNSHYINCDFVVSPDGSKYYSNLTGMMYETPLDENGRHLDVTDPRVNKDNRGTSLGYGEEAVAHMNDQK